MAKEKLKEWYRRRGVLVPWSGASNDNTETNVLANPVMTPSNDAHVSQKLGRPTKIAWVFIRRRSRELQRKNRSKLTKIIAAKVLSEAANDFSSDNLPAESTVIKEMGKILKGI